MNMVGLMCVTVFHDKVYRRGYGTLHDGLYTRREEHENQGISNEYVPIMVCLSLTFASLSDHD